MVLEPESVLGLEGLLEPVLSLEDRLSELVLGQETVEVLDPVLDQVSDLV